MSFDPNLSSLAATAADYATRKDEQPNAMLCALDARQINIEPPIAVGGTAARGANVPHHWAADRPFFAVHCRQRGVSSTRLSACGGLDASGSRADPLKFDRRVHLLDQSRFGLRQLAKQGGEPRTRV
ncbi:MAG TPA: hypothetical protein VGR32_05225 [Brevundimonas sp.]|uniref:hypothetical protein n=1 Tax=Brevundimonas sp. TaxID=1871086 RepID=UPI002DE6B4F1|nr:hypothetical protein [Brevundimonas sp.]